MEIDRHSLPEDPAAVRHMVVPLLEELEAKERRLRRVQHLLEQWLRWRYGQKREPVDENQLFLFAAALVRADKHQTTPPVEPDTPPAPPAAIPTRFTTTPPITAGRDRMRSSGSFTGFSRPTRTRATTSGTRIPSAPSSRWPAGRGVPSGPGEDRWALRQARSRPILDDIQAYLEAERPKVLPKSPEGQAMAYMLSNWAALVRYCQDGDLEIDNHGAERSLRGVAAGRTAAVLNSLVAICCCARPKVSSTCS